MKPANLLMIRELNVNGCGDFADVLFQLEHPLSSEENRALRVELTQTQAGDGRSRHGYRDQTRSSQYFRAVRCMERLRTY